MHSVVILDENSPIRELLTEWLVAEGHSVLNAHQLSALTALEIDIVLIDLPRLREGAISAFSSSVASFIAPVRAVFVRAALIGMSTQLTVSLPRGSPIARELGLWGLLAKPCGREELLALLHGLPQLPRQPETDS